jgi:hypothetical protein
MCVLDAIKFAKLNRNSYAVEAGLVFCSVVRCRKINYKDIVELFIGW